MIRSFEGENPDNEMWNTFICGSDFYFMDFVVGINLYVAHHETGKFTNLRQVVELTAKNDYSQESVLIEIITLYPAEVWIAFWWFVLFLVVFILFILCFTKNLTSKIISDPKKSKSKPSNDTEYTLSSMQTMTTNENSSISSFNQKRDKKKSEEVLYATTATFKRDSTQPRGTQTASMIIAESA